jgi:uncharacterized protein YbjT (DUF2867 family)
MSNVKGVTRKTVLLTGATGFVGRAVRPALEADGWHVRCMTRNAEHARRLYPDVDWVQGDVGDPYTCARAVDGCEAALYLVHGIGEGGDYHAREVAAARVFSSAAGAASCISEAWLQAGVAPNTCGVESTWGKRFGLDL